MMESTSGKQVIVRPIQKKILNYSPTHQAWFLDDVTEENRREGFYVREVHTPDEDTLSLSSEDYMPLENAIVPAGSEPPANDMEISDPTPEQEFSMERTEDLNQEEFPADPTIDEPQEITLPLHPTTGDVTQEEILLPALPINAEPLKLPEPTLPAVELPDYSVVASDDSVY